jgi:hypothetical protein
LRESDTMVVGVATPSDKLFPSVHFLTELGALLGRHGYTPAQVPAAYAVGQAIPELIAFLSACGDAPPTRAPQSGDVVTPFYATGAGHAARTAAGPPKTPG